MTTIYKSLATHLDKLPGGYPPTPSGVELRILERLFTRQEASIAVYLTLRPEPPGKIAQRVGQAEETLAPVLYEMSKKGLIVRKEKDGKRFYMAAQFMVGIWEYHVNDLDAGLIRDVNEYLPYLTRPLSKIRTQQLRVIPISKSIPADIQVLPYEQAEEIIRRQSKIVVAPCICRKEHQIMGHGCDKPLEACLVFGGAAHYYEGNGIGREISKDEALAILHEGIEAGLVLQPGNAKSPSNICMCCGCCCQILKMLKRSDRPTQIACTNYYAEIDEAACTACGNCEDRCQMAAVSVEDVARVDLNRCIGCGLCIAGCDIAAIRMVEKRPEDRWDPPETVVGTYVNIAKERGVI